MGVKTIDSRSIFVAPVLLVLLSAFLGACGPRGCSRPSETETLADAVLMSAEQKAEILQEIIRTVTRSEPDSGADGFTGWLGALGQGASFEGVYNGLVHSEAYRVREADVKNHASSRAVTGFAEEMTWIQSQMRAPNIFAESDAAPLARTVQPIFEVESKLASPPRWVKDFEPDELIKSYVERFSRASIYTLKRVAGDELLRAFDEKITHPEDFSHWYIEWIQHMNRHGVDFGLEVRNKIDPAVQRRWVLQADPDLIRWEMLNRIHRVLNALQDQTDKRR